jgi:hypothetical protein
MTIIDEVYARFAITRFPLPSERDIAELEKRTECRFPENYRQFLLQFNGGYFSDPEIAQVGDGFPNDSLRNLFGIRAPHEEAELGLPRRTALFDDNDPPKILPIGLTSMGGLIILDVAPGDGQGAIFLKVAFGGFHYLCESIEEFCELLKEPDW